MEYDVKVGGGEEELRKSGRGWYCAWQRQRSVVVIVAGRVVGVVVVSSGVIVVVVVVVGSARSPLLTSPVGCRHPWLQQSLCKAVITGRAAALEGQQAGVTRRLGGGGEVGMLRAKEGSEIKREFLTRIKCQAWLRLRSRVRDGSGVLEAVKEAGEGAVVSAWVWWCGEPGRTSVAVAVVPES